MKYTAKLSREAAFSLSSVGCYESNRIEYVFLVFDQLSFVH